MTIPLPFRLSVLLPLYALAGIGYLFGVLPAWSAFIVWSLLLGAGLGFHSARLRRWMTRFPAEGYIEGRRQLRLAAAAAWVGFILLLIYFPPMRPLDLRSWCFSLATLPTVALLHTGGMAGTMMLVYLLIPPGREEKKSLQLLRMRWAITILSFTIFYLGLSVSLAIAAPRTLPLMVTLFLTPVAFCLAHDEGLKN